ncbi:prepilin-type N-terminal cleavage/methylation domain-containing protein [Dyella sp. LX-66]|uniref:type IV pilin protein n=1 Tax=unclassified Dyella TaxID=2634549 RepID=UPI001BDFFF73|nr:MULTISPECIES: prepilin-type N-terminal cleavage/methylation domain-containing protein [unclassified Dyella]MBT2119825.1 prepilin-type N-terminal cleavage/methylation domain-containing protein [Dyella sp. LX-1]MBT2142302.1 prepilin-type N-terminal cleavage/methylation domain-containing protein [Dyella sp. LX-66]
MSSVRPAARLRVRGFSLIELMVVLAIVAILTAIAVSSYLSYVLRSKVRTAQGDLVALSLNLENMLQRQLQYPQVTTTSTDDTVQQFTGWHPAQINDFTYTVVSTKLGYTLTAAGIRGSLATCKLTLDATGKRQVPGPCGSITSW